MSDSDEADSEVQRLTALSFHSLSCPDERYLHKHRAWDTAAPSLAPCGKSHKPTTNRTTLRAADFTCHSEDDVACARPKAAPVPNLSDESGREQFECVDVDLENYGAKKDFSKKTVPKRKILLKRREKNEMNACPAGNAPAQQSVALDNKEQHLQNSNSGLNGYVGATKEPEGKERFLRAVSLDEATYNSRFASCHVKDVLARKMQTEHSLRMEQPLAKDVLLAQSSGHGKNSGMRIDDEPSSLSKPETDCSSKVQPRNSTKRSSSKCVFPNSSSFFKQYSGISPGNNALTNARKQNRKYLNSEKVGELRKRPTHANYTQLNSSETNTEVEKTREEQQTDTKPESITQWPNCKPLSATAVMNRLRPGPTKRTANQYRKVLIRDEKRDDSSEIDLPSVNIFTSKTPQIKLMPQVNSEQKNNTFSICRVINLQRKSDVGTTTTLSTSKREIESPAATSSSNLFCNSDANISKSSHSDSWEATEDKNNPNSWMRQTRDVSKLKKESYSAGIDNPTSSIVQTLHNQENTIAKTSDSIHKGPLSLAPPFIQCKAICQKDLSQNVTSLHEKQMFDKVDSVDELKGSQFPIQDEKHPDLYSRRANTRTTHVHGIEYASLNSPPLDNLTPSHARDNINVLSENKDPVEQTKNEGANQSKISHITIQRTLNLGEKVVMKESHLNVRVNSKPPQCLNNPESDLSTAEEEDLPSKTKQDLKSPCLTQVNSFDSSTAPAPGSQDISDTSSGHNKETDGTIWNSPNDGVNLEPSIPLWFACDSFTDINTDSSVQKNVFAETKTATVQEIKQDILSPLHSEHESGPLDPDLPGGNCEEAHPQCNSTGKSAVPVNLETGTNVSVNDNIRSAVERNSNENKMCDITEKHDSLAHLFAELDPQYSVPLNVFEGYKKEAKSPSGSSVLPSTSVQARHIDMNPELLRKVQNVDEDASSPSQPGTAPYFTIPFQEHKSSVETRSSASTLPQSSTASGASSTASSISNFSFFTQGDSDLSQSGTPGKEPQEILQEKLLLGEPFENFKPTRKQPQCFPGKSTARSAQVSEEAIPCNRGVSCRGIPCVHHPQMQRKMLIDPDSGKCYYIEPPRNPHLKMLYDPETGQYVEVLIPPLPVPPHAGFYQAPFPPMVLSSDCYGSSYLQYPGFTGFSPPLTMPHVHPDLQNQQHRHDHQITSGNCTHIPKQEVHVNQQDNPLERLYYIPTGMTSSPTPSQSLLSQASCCSPIMVDKGHFYKVPLHQTHNKTNS